IASDYIVGRNEALEDVFDTLFVEKSLLTVTGARGMGKTVLAEAVATASLRMGMVERVIQVGVTSKTSFDQVMNAIVLHANQPHLADLDYRNKFVSVEQLLETEATLLILDQQETGDVFTDEFKMRVDAMSKPARVIICSLDPWDDVHNVVLQPLDTVAVMDLFNTVAGVGLESDSDITLLHTVTGGSPLAVTLFASSLNNSPQGLHDVLAQVNDEIIRVPSDLSHGAILSWCWGLLNPTARRILTAFMEFDPLEGPSPALLRELHPDLSEAVVQNVLRQLETMRLIERRNGDGERPVYRWHSLLHEFLNTIDTPEADAPRFRASVQERFFTLYMDYLTRHREDYQLLDRQQHNLLHAFDLGFAQGRTSMSQVNTFLPYLIARGLYELANRIVESTLQSRPDRQTGDYIELLLNSAKADLRRGEFQRAEQQLNEALALTDQLDNRRNLGELYHQLGNVARIQGQYEESKHFLDMALQYARDTQDAKSICMILANMGVKALENGDFETAKWHLQESLESAHLANVPRVTEFAQTSLSIIALEQFDFVRAAAHLKEAQKLAQQIGSPERQAIISLTASAAYYYQARYRDMRTNLANALEIAQKLQHEELTANIVRNLGRCEAAEGNLLGAEGCYRQALGIAVDRGIKRLIASVLLDLGKIGFQTHNKDFAYRCFYDALAQASAVQNYELVAEALFGLGITSAAEAWIIGPDDAAQTIQVIHQSWDEDLLAKLPRLPITEKHLYKAAFFFQHGLINFPEIQRYRVVEAIAELTNPGGEG
ncbi:MAG: hypothetical protein K8I60_11130, partial [Anaerolineae bacterium]|nr:hypothetical protein [Anaerolineae bacterium]